MKTLKDYSLPELKALGYDTITEIGRHNANLKAINDEIETRKSEVNPPQGNGKLEPKEEVKD